MRMLALALALVACEAAAQQPPADPACAPDVAAALEAEAASGASAEILAIRDPVSGIREPMSILDFSCISDMFNYGIYDIFFDPGAAMEDILDLVNRRICAAARDAYRDAIGRQTTPSFIRDIRRLPGVRVTTDRWRLTDELEDADLNRLIIEGG